MNQKRKVGESEADNRNKPTSKKIKQSNPKRQKDKENEQPNKRPDRTEKLKQRSILQETVVKCCLLKHLYGDTQTKMNIVDAIDKRVLSFSQRYVVATLGYSYAIRNLFEEKNVLDVQLPCSFFDQTFARQFMLGMDGTTVHNDIVHEFMNQYPQFYENIERHFSDRNIYTHGSTLLLTNLVNHFQLNLQGVIKRCCHGENKHETMAGLYLVNGLLLPSWLNPVFPQKAEFYEHIAMQRKVLGLEGEEKVTIEWTKSKSNLQNIIRYFIFANRYLQANNLTLFKVTPLASIRRHFITMDADVLYGIMRDCNLIECNLKTFSPLAKEHWESIMKIKKLQGKNNVFTGTVQSDGVSICVHFQRPKTALDESLKMKGKKGAQYLVQNENIIIGEGDRVIAIDPGRTNIIYAVEIINGVPHVYILTRGQYYTESGIFAARKKTQKWLSKIKNQLDDMSRLSIKNISMASFEMYMVAYSTYYDALWTELSHTKWSRQRLRLYAGKQRVVEKFFNKIKKGDGNQKGKRIVIAYGTGCNVAGGKNEMSVPVSKIFKMTLQRFIVKLTDEHRSTKVCHEDDSILENVVRKDTNQKLRGLLWCSSTNNNKFVNRDFNAAMNILRCAISIERPQSLTHDHPKVIMRVGKKIKR
jgi:hypothetical protein